MPEEVLLVQDPLQTMARVPPVQEGEVPMQGLPAVGVEIREQLTLVEAAGALKLAVLAVLAARFNRTALLLLLAPTQLRSALGQVIVEPMVVPAL
jgi:hypothetical protein